MVVSVINQKGGVGKTSACVNIGAAMRLDGAKVVFVDIDRPQLNLSGRRVSVSPSKVLTPNAVDLMEFLQRNRKEHVIIDCPPKISSSDPSTSVALLHSDIVLVPIAALTAALAGAYSIQALLEQYKERNQRIQVKYFVTRLKPVKACREIRNEARDSFGDDFLSVTVPEHSALFDADELDENIFQYAPNSPGGHAFYDLTQELLTHVAKL